MVDSGNLDEATCFSLSWHIKFGCTPFLHILDIVVICIIYVIAGYHRMIYSIFASFAYTANMSDLRFRAFAHTVNIRYLRFLGIPSHDILTV